MDPTQIKSGAPETIGQHTTLSPGNSCSQAGAKCTSLLLFGPHQQGGEDGLGVWAAQDFHTHCPGLHPKGHFGAAEKQQNQHGR